MRWKNTHKQSKAIGLLYYAFLFVLCINIGGQLRAQLDCTTNQTFLLSGQTFTISATGANTTAPYLQYYLLVDAAGNIVDANDTGAFDTSALPTDANYSVHALNFDSNDAPSPLTSGSPSPSQLLPTGTVMLSAISGGCYDAAALTGLIDDFLCIRVVEPPACQNVCQGDDLVITSTGYEGAGHGSTTYELWFYLVDDTGMVVANSGNQVGTGEASFSTTTLDAGETYEVYVLSFDGNNPPSFLPITTDASSLTTIPSSADFSNATGCFNADFLTDYLCYTVNALPTVMGDPVTVCAGEAIDLAITASGNGTLSYSWTTTSSNGFTSTAEDPQVAAMAALSDAGTYTVVVTDDNGTTDTADDCTAMTDIVVTVNALPTVSAGTYGPLCEADGTITLTGSPLEGTVVGDMGEWAGTGVTDNGDGTAMFDPTGLTASSPITVTYTYTDDNGCSDFATTDITVLDCDCTPVNVCQGNDLVITSAGYEGAGHGSTTYELWFYLVDDTGMVVANSGNQVGTGEASFPTTTLDAGETYEVYVLSYDSNNPPSFLPPMTDGSSLTTIPSSADFSNATGCFNADFLTDYLCYTIIAPPDAGNDAALSVCNDIYGSLPTALDLAAAIGMADAGGVWSETTASGVDLTDPSNVAFTGVAAGTYTFVYTVTGTAPCPDDMATVMVTVEDCACPANCDEASFPWNGQN